MKLQLQTHDTFFLFGVHSTCPTLMPPYWQVGCTPFLREKECLTSSSGDILWTSHVKTTCQALGLNNRSLEHPSVKVCCEVELHRHPVRSDSLHCSFSFTLVVLYVTAVWPAFARLINLDITSRQVSKRKKNQFGAQFFREHFFFNNRRFATTKTTPTSF